MAGQGRKEGVEVAAKREAQDKAQRTSSSTSSRPSLCAACAHAAFPRPAHARERGGVNVSLLRASDNHACNHCIHKQDPFQEVLASDPAGNVPRMSIDTMLYHLSDLPCRLTQSGSSRTTCCCPARPARVPRARQASAFTACRRRRREVRATGATWWRGRCGRRGRCW